MRWAVSMLIAVGACAAAPADGTRDGGAQSAVQDRAAPSAPVADTKTQTEPAHPVSPLPAAPPSPRIISFAWRPSGGPAAAYEMAAPEDQHRIVLFPDVTPGRDYPVVVGFHGQPPRDKAPRDYGFLKTVPEIASAVAASGRLEPFVLVLPVFRFLGQNWPGFDPKAFTAEVRKRLAAEGIRVRSFAAFGHSGAAGCGGDGLNRIHEMRPRPLAVGFFDTCLGTGWQDAVRALAAQRIRVIDVHSVETAGFRPRQRPEYQGAFDFGRAFEPLGLAPIRCPEKHPAEKLREQKFRCAATADRFVRAFVVDTGEGQEAHEAVLPAAIPYFLEQILKPR